MGLRESVCAKGVAAVLMTALVVGGLLAGAAAQERRYRIGAKDVLKVTVWGHDDLSKSLTVSADGTIQFPLVGDVPAAGLTPTQVEVRLKELLGKDYLVDPQVSVAVQDYRSQRVFVLGEAEKPGAYYLTGQTSLIDVLSQAGGGAKTAGREVIVVRAPKSEGPVNPGTAGATTFRVSLKKLFDGDGGENLLLENGDTVVIPKLTGFFVQGEVQKPGAYPLEKDTTAQEAVTLAGGLTPKANPGVAAILRKRPDGTQERIEVNLAGSDPKTRATLLADGDTLVVPAEKNTFFVMGEVKKPGAYPLEQAGTALEGIAVAGGFTDKAAPNRTRIIRNHKDGRQESILVDLNDVIKRGRKDRDIPLSANDVIVVPESFF